MDGQDWEPVILRKPRVHTSSYASVAASAVGKVQVQGQAQRNKILDRDGAKRSEAAHTAKIEASDVPVKPKMLTSESRKLLVASRLLLKKSQVELNNLCAFPPNTIRELESGRISPTGSQLNKLNQILRIGLKLE